MKSVLRNVIRPVIGKSSGSSWTPLTLVVEDATPTHVDITFPSAKTVLASDFTIAGFMVLSGSWTGSVYTLVLSVAVIETDSLTVVYKTKSYPVTNNVVSYYVDIFVGSNANNGSKTAPFATVTYADSVLSLNAPLKLKYPNEKWVIAPACWHGLKALFPMRYDGVNNNLYDVANGIIGIIPIFITPLAFQYSGYKFDGIAAAIELSVGDLGMGTEDLTIIINIRPTQNDNGLYVIFSQGAFANWAGYGLAQYEKKLGFQMRKTGTLIYKYTDAQTIPNDFIFAATVKRNNANGLKLYLNGVYTNSPGESTASLGVDNLTNAVKTLIGAGDTNTYPIKADWIKELRIYNRELSAVEVASVYDEMIVNAATVYKFASGDYVAIGIGSFYGACKVHLFQGFNKEGQFHFMPEVTYTGRPDDGFGNAKILPLIANKCNNTVAPIAGEINWIMTCESTAATPMYLAKSYNGIDWEYMRQLPANCLGQGDFFVDNDDPSDYTNIHVITFKPNAIKSYIYETHPTSADFSTWSDAVSIYENVGYIYNETVVLIDGVYHMFYASHYMLHATCDSEPWSADQNWTLVQTGNWSGLGVMESYSILHLGGDSWIIYYNYLGVTTVEDPANYRQKYAITNDNFVTFETPVEITELCPPTLQFSVGYVKLK